jgi:hypothetical protein
MDSTNLESKYSTYEEKELKRLRSSYSFRLGVIITEIFKNPFRILLLPWSLFKLFFNKSKTSYIEQTLQPNSIVLVGIDKRGANHLEMIQTLLRQFQNSGRKYKISILSTGSEVIEEHKEECIHYRIPSPRTIHSSYKDWNIVCERLLETIIKISDASKVIFLGDYLYSGVINSMNHSHPDVKFLWINPNETVDGLEKIHQTSKSIAYQKVFSSALKNEKGLQKVESIVNLNSENQKIIHNDLSLEQETKFLLTALERAKQPNVVFIQHEELQVNHVDTHVVQTDMNPYLLDGIYVRLIDDEDEKIKQMLISKTPSIVFRSNPEKSYSSNSMLEQLEKIGAIIVIRHLTLAAVDDAITTILDVHAIESMRSNWNNFSSNEMLNLILTQFESI